MEKIPGLEREIVVSSRKGGPSKIYLHIYDESFCNSRREFDEINSMWANF